MSTPEKGVRVRVIGGGKSVGVHFTDEQLDDVPTMIETADGLKFGNPVVTVGPYVFTVKGLLEAGDIHRRKAE